jgi:hypothetical protein
VTLSKRAYTLVKRRKCSSHQKSVGNFRIGTAFPQDVTNVRNVERRRNFKACN